ncbi:MAG: TIGR03790 family protein [Phycisphaerae bacterium]|nr:TIGR03790 family protein [Phycisphaerae bacterium]
MSKANERFLIRGIAGLAVSAALTGGALAGGSGENVILIIDPTDAASMYLGNYYRQARNIPDANVIYLDSVAPGSYQAFVTTLQPAFVSELAARGLSAQADYVVLAPIDSFYLGASNLLSDGCFPVNRVALPSAYSLTFVSDEVLSATLASTEANRYTANSKTFVPFYSTQKYYGGAFANSDSRARQYYLGTLLGYTGFQGNSVEEIRAMIDRSVAVDGTRRPENAGGGRFYYMNNTSDPARNVRNTQFNQAIADLASVGYVGEKISGLLPIDRFDSLGILSGFAVYNIDGAGYGVLPGSFCDHLTSFAATFDDTSQTKMSRWIAKGASGTAGAVEEPCNYTGKFPHSRLHVWYAQGASLGEAWFRSLGFMPFQDLFIGDPLTRPFAYFPIVDAPALPALASGTLAFTPTGTATKPGASVVNFSLFVDGVFRQKVNRGSAFSFDTRTVPDGPHDVRVYAIDSASARHTGVWSGTLTTGNFGRAVSLTAPVTTGTLAQSMMFNVSASGWGVREVQLLSNSRVVAASSAASSSMELRGQSLGAGVSRVVARALFLDGTSAVSAPVTVNLSFDPGTPSGAPPVAYSYTKRINPGQTGVVELPAAFDTDPSAVVYESFPVLAHATVTPGIQGAYRLIRPTAGATGKETFTFRVLTPSGSSNTATVTVRYSDPCGNDFNDDGSADDFDFFDFLNALFAGQMVADINGDGSVDDFDFFDFLNHIYDPCP